MENINIPGAVTSPRTVSDLKALWIMDLPRHWSSYTSIPRHTDIVMSFMVFCNATWAGKTIAFLIANCCRDMFHDGLNDFRIGAISFLIENDRSLGFVAFRNITPKWFDAVRTTPMYTPAIGSDDSWFATYPLLDNELGTKHNVEQTLTTAR